MNMEEIKSFLAVYKHQSISQAALFLYLSQPTLSSKIKGLEKKVGVDLFDRSWEGVKLTEQGRIFLPYAIKILTKYENLIDLSGYFAQSIYSFDNKTMIRKQSADNMYVIGIDDMIVNEYAPRIIDALRSEYPNLQFDIMNTTPKELTNGFNYGFFNFIIYNLFTDGLKNNHFISHDEMVIVLCEEDYRHINGDTYRLKELNKPVLLKYDPITERSINHLNSDININNYHVINSFDIIKMAVHSKYGYTITTNTQYETSFKKEGLYKIHFPENKSLYSIYGAYHKAFSIQSEYLINNLRNNTF